jgi:AraC-like DNA-binding protein
MIKPMIDASFLSYGIVERFRREPNHTLDHIPVTSRAEVPIYSFPVPTSWDYVDGMTVLLILDGAERKRYYLDRAVTIHPGVRFGFYPLGQSSTVAGDPTILTPDTCELLLDLSDNAPDGQRMQLFTLFRQIGQEGLFFRGEQHPPLELVYVEKGVLENYCNGQKFTLHPNEFLIFGSNQWHMQYADRDVRFLTAAFSWEGHDFSRLCNRVLAAPSEIQHSVQALLQEYEQDLPRRDEFLYTQMKMLFLQILRLPDHEDTTRKHSPVSELVHRAILDKAMQIVSEKIYGKLSVSDLATAVNVSTSQLTVLFRTYLGMTPAKYITHIRLEESKSLLSEKKMSIGEIADLLGYASVQHYSKQFRSWFGCTPSEYAGRKKTMR